MGKQRCQSATSCRRYWALQILVLCALSSFQACRGRLSSYVPMRIPKALAVPTGNEFVAAFPAIGFQEYEFNGTAWVSTNVSARLDDLSTGETIGDHFFLGEPDSNGGRATWELYGQWSSRVTAQPIGNVTPTGREGAIPWLLLQSTSTSGTKTELGSVTFVQRLNTVEGLPPSVHGAKLGNMHRSNYAALYIFYRLAPRPLF